MGEKTLSLKESKVCLWCFKRHREGTKIKAKHEKLLDQLRKGKLPCEIGGCRLYLCSRLHAIISVGLEKFGNCNHLLAEVNRINHFVELVHEEA